MGSRARKPATRSHPQRPQKAPFIEVKDGHYRGEGKTTTEGRVEIVRRAAAGESNCSIAHTLGVTPKTVRLWLQRYNQSGSVDRVNTRPGPPPSVLTKPCMRVVRGLVAKFPGTAADVQRQAAARGHPMSERTTRVALQKLGAKSRAVQHKPPLTPENAKKRLEYSKAHLDWDWTGVVFVDESAMGARAPRRALSLPGNVPPSVHVNKRQGLLHFMGYISAAGNKSKLHFLEPRQTWTGKLIKKHCRGLLRPGLKVVLDGATTHGHIKAAIVAAGGQVLPHPPYSPDLNPIENVWETLKHKVAEKGPLPREVLEKELQAAWKAITPAHFKAYAASMGARLQAVIDSKGEHTKY